MFQHFLLHSLVRFRYPLFLNLENHCSNKQQILVAKLLLDVFGGKISISKVFKSLRTISASIYTASEVNACSVWPSPEQLKGRIIIRVSHIFD